jgi:hypothetical protein
LTMQFVISQRLLQLNNKLAHMLNTSSSWAEYPIQIFDHQII